MGSNLPAGFNLSSGGVLSSTGNPAATSGTYTFTVVATDSVGATAQKQLSLTVDKPLLIRVDANRDGTISFTDNTDQTTASTPFPFWVNGERTIAEPDTPIYDPYGNIIGTIPGEQESGNPDPILGPLDSSRADIPYERELDNFLRLQIQMPSTYDPSDPTWTCTLQFTQVVGTDNPTIRLWQAVKPGLEYLSDINVASQQIALPQLAVVNTAQATQISPTVFANPNKTAALLFEAVASGQAALTVRLYKGGNLVSEDNLYLNLKPITKMYDHWTVGNDTTSSPASHPNQIGQADATSDRTSDYILFIHGWRLQPWERRAFAESAFKRLWHLHYKGGFGLFSWPTQYTDNPLLDPENYDQSENKAWASATGLHELLATLASQHPGQVYLFAHSMGNVVASEALRLESEANTPNKLAQVYVASQAAIAANAYDQAAPAKSPGFFGSPDIYKSYPLTGQPYFSGTRDFLETGGLRRAADKLVNFFNKDDYALNLWLYDQSTKPDGETTRRWSYMRNAYGNKPAGFYRWTSSNPSLHLDYLTDRYEIFSRAASAYSNALGATPSVHGPFTAEIDLDAKFHFGNSQSGHSAEFYGTMAARRGYWDQLLSSFGLMVQ